jgi:aarF domain-containing kinase
MSIIRSDVKAIESYAMKLGAGELFGLLACMASGRSWNAILSGIDKQGKSKEEESEIKNDAAKYLVR